jgi:hypothetical protein
MSSSQHSHSYLDFDQSRQTTRRVDPRTGEVKRSAERKSSLFGGLRRRLGSIKPAMMGSSQGSLKFDLQPVDDFNVKESDSKFDQFFHETDAPAVSFNSERPTGISSPQTTDMNLGQTHCLASRAPTLDL